MVLPGQVQFAGRGYFGHKQHYFVLKLTCQSQPLTLCDKNKFKLIECSATKGAYEGSGVSQRGSLKKEIYRVLRSGVNHRMILVGICKFLQTRICSFKCQAS